ncbi:nicotinate-nucleotide adenylyltransferase [Methylacidiphilum sp. Yel]|jgi:hypothetical protein|uniref:TonB-dependent receptor n=1 Tax=Methylacidiphilum sp. Yel TaxID=1847730 RepID=UPI00106D8E36|nr:TonB-dependent receptor [Methylacidiphilum sp. Yel]TFE66316.1 nicotinate-nucleotide adenylyltransferase [Methylacidiphilum sp. Yel]
MDKSTLTTHQKALQINLDSQKYGTFAEIGGGQEVVRWFFKVGGAAGTVAKSISAYDMTVSDAIYGPTERYVCQERLSRMLDHEYDLLIDRLEVKRGKNTQFFVFADTVTIQGYQQRMDCHGWMGIRFQDNPMGKWNDVIIHVRFLEQERLQQQETLGILGVNLIYGAFYYNQDLVLFIESLMDNIAPGKIEIDLIDTSGHLFEKIDLRLLNLQLLVSGLTPVILFTPNGKAVQPSDLLYKKAILIERGRFEPVTNLNMEMMEVARAKFLQEPEIADAAKLEIMEITTRNLLTEMGTIDKENFIQRIELLCALKQHVLISNYAEFYEISTYLNRFTKNLIGLVLGIPLLQELFNEKYYSYVEGGILEAMGRLFKKKIKLYVYPTFDPQTSKLITAENLEIKGPIKHIYNYLLESNHLIPLHPINPPLKSFSPKEVTEYIKSGDPRWKELVPIRVVEIIREKKYFGYKELEEASSNH